MRFSSTAFVHDNHSAAAATMMCPAAGLGSQQFGENQEVASERASLWNFFRGRV